MSDSTTSSLRQRLQNRLPSFNKDLIRSLGCNPDIKDDSSSDESDIDDNITLEECTAYVNQKQNKKSYTNLTQKVKSTATISSKPVSLKNIISHKLDQKNEKYNAQETDNSIDIVSNGICGSSASDTHRELKTNHFNQAGESNLVSKGNSIETDNVAFTCIDHENEAPVKRKKLTDVEKKLAKEQKEKEKLEKRKEREKLRLEKAMEKEAQKAKKKVSNLNNRSERKDECMEKILAIIDPSLIQPTGSADVLKALQDVNIRYEIKELPVASCMGWMRETIDYNVTGRSEILKSSHYSEEDHFLYKMTAAELAARITAKLKHLNEEETLDYLLFELKQAYKNKKITIVVTGMNAYNRFVKTKKNQRFRNQALGEEPTTKKRKKREDVPLLTKDEIDDELVSIQVNTSVFIRFCEDMEMFCQFVTSFTKSLAEAPFKKSDETSLRFHSSAPAGKSCVKIGSDGHGVLELWNQQLQQFYGVRHDTSVAITQVYPTPLSLMKEYRSISTSDGLRLLQDIEIRRGIGVLQTQRRVGPELSKRIYKLFTSVDGNEMLAK